MVLQPKTLSTLGSVDISAQPNQSASEMQEAQIPAGEFVIACKNASEMLDLVDETLNQMSLLVKMPVIHTPFFAIRPGRNHSIGILFPNILEKCL